MYRITIKYRMSDGSHNRQVQEYKNKESIDEIVDYVNDHDWWMKVESIEQRD